MSSRLKTALAAAVMTTCAGSLAFSAHARDSDVGAYLTGQTGYYWYDNDLSLEDDVEYGLGFGYNFTNAMALEFVGSRINTERNDIKRDIDRDQLRLDFLYTLPGYESMKPYFVVGGGRQFFKAKNVDTDDMDMYNAGVGIKHEIGDFTDIRLDARAIHSTESNATNGVVTIALNWLFGAEGTATRDSDRDGVYDVEDECADTPRGREVDEVGCELPGDDDNDGVTNDVDECPDTTDGVEVDAKGCEVMADTDGDGVTDDMDECPNTPDGTAVNESGCPLDEDGDGISDADDQCPDTPAGAVVDTNGCEVFLTENVERKLNLTFPLNSAILPLNEVADVKRLAEFMSNYPEANVVIAGHSDSTGDADYNQQLSERRAKAVRDLVVGKYGISPSRISSKGYGESEPVADNGTADGRAANRRVVAIAEASVKTKAKQ